MIGKDTAKAEDVATMLVSMYGSSPIEIDQPDAEEPAEDNRR